MNFGAHCLYLSKQCALDAQSLGVQIYSEEAPEFTLLTGLLRWMSDTTCVVASVKFMARVYKLLFDYMSAGESSNALGRREFVKLLQDDCPILWFPAENEVQWDLFVDGQMWRRSDVILSDPTEKFNFEQSPVKVLGNIYTDVSQLFSRKLCAVCRAHEGMFGACGAPLSERKISAQMCSCVVHGFNLFVPDMPGLVRSSPSLGDMISLLRHFKDKYETKRDDESESESESLLMKRRKRIREDMKTTMVSISKEVWKCFNIENSLLPYSPGALRSAREAFQSESLLITLNGLFVRSQDTTIASIVVDDKSMFECFKDEFFDKNICLIDGMSEDEVSLPNKHTCLDTLTESRRAFMDLPCEEFMLNTGYIPGETFFAPNNSLSLMQFLEVPCLSHYVTETSSFAEKTDDITKTTELLNGLLRLVQMFLLDSEISYIVDHQLLYSTRVRALIDMKIYGCDSLKYALSLTIPQLGIEASRENLTRDFFHDTVSNTLLVGHQCSYDVRRDLCIGLVMKAIRIEVALLQRNQCVDIMKSLHSVLKKYSRREEWKVRE